MVKLLADRLEGGCNIAIVDEPTGLWIDLAAHGNLASKRMPVKPRALVSFGNAGQTVGRFKGEFFNKLNDHCESILASRGNGAQRGASSPAGFGENGAQGLLSRRVVRHKAQGLSIMRDGIGFVSSLG